MKCHKYVLFWTSRLPTKSIILTGIYVNDVIKVWISDKIKKHE